MDSKSPIVFIRTGDTDLALRLVRVLNQHGISGFWVTTEESEKLRHSPHPTSTTADCE